jgi:hypothetical protein
MAGQLPEKKAKTIDVCATVNGTLTAVNPCQIRAEKWRFERKVVLPLNRDFGS